MNPTSPIFFITGPTGVGKTGIAARVAEMCNGEIIGADAFQIYCGMDILTGKPSRETLAQIPHHLVDTIPIDRSFDVAQYLELAERAIAEVTARNKLPLITGGTGLYVRALTHVLSELPTADAGIRLRLEKLSLEELQSEYKRLDPEGARKIDLKNRRRLVRGIEVCELTGKAFSAYQGQWKKRPGAVSGVFLTRDRDDLYSRIDRRVLEMMQAGLLDEVRCLPEAGRTAGQAIGLREAQACLDGRITPDECIAQIQRATRRYAKRQLTWFRSEPLFEEINISHFSSEEQVAGMISQKATLFAGES